MEFYGDYHMHSIYSDGRGTLEEMVMAADKCRLLEIGIADHGPGSLGTGVKNEGTFHAIKEELRELQSLYPGLKVLAGAEANIISRQGGLDISRKVIRELDYVIAGLHPFILPHSLGDTGWVLANMTVPRLAAFRKWAKNTNTKALVETIYTYEIMAVSHPGLKMEIDIAETARACVSRNTAWEINTGHQFPSYGEVLEAARCGVDFIVNSDAHFPETVGCFDYGAWVLEKAKVPLERIINAREKKI